MTDILRAMGESRSIFFDLDGTLTDPYVGIQRCIEHALQALGEPAGDDYRWAIGPPLRQSFVKLVGDARADEALHRYRERYAEIGWRENLPYPGIDEALNALVVGGHRLFVATSKPHTFARRILEHFDLLPHFRNVYGAELDGTRGDKASLLRYALNNEGQPVNAIMIGDRRFDIDGARANGMQAWGVLYGYGTADELADADGLLRSVSELDQVIR